MKAIISQLYVYPIKGCAGQPMHTAMTFQTGFAHDRQWMVVDAATGRFVTQRSHPRMALIRPTINMHSLHIEAPAQDSLELNIAASEGICTVNVWRDTLTAIDMGDTAAQWFSNTLQHSVRLVRFSPEQQRLCKSAAFGQSVAQVYFADAYPYLLLSEASLQTLNERLLEAGSQAVGMDRFRPNIVITGVDAHTEDYAASFTHISGIQLHCISQCTRCVVPTIDQQTALLAADGQPSWALSQYRYDSVQDGVVFGMNVQMWHTHMPSTHIAKLTVGDELTVNLAF